MATAERIETLHNSSLRNSVRIGIFDDQNEAAVRRNAGTLKGDLEGRFSFLHSVPREVCRDILPPVLKCKLERVPVSVTKGLQSPRFDVS